MDLLLRGATVLTMDGDGRALPRGDVLVRGGRIEAVGEGLEAPGAAELVEAAGHVLLPGLVQAHVHLCQTLFRNRGDGLPLLEWLRTRIWPLEAALDEASLRLSAELGICELLRGGTTAVLDMGTVRHTDAIFEASAAAGFRITSGKAHMDAGDGVPPGLREETDASLAEAEALCLRWHGRGLARYAFAPRFLLSCSDGLLAELAGLARSRSARLHTHAGENVAEGEAVRARFGADALEVLADRGLVGPDAVVAHGVHLTPAEETILAASGTTLAHCPASNLKLGSGIARIPELLARGVRVAIGTDGAACNDGLDMLAEVRLTGLLHRPRSGPAALPARRVLELATMGGARALGLEDEIGSIEPGKRADLLLLDARGVHAVPPGDDPHALVVFALGRGDVRGVWVEGRRLLQDGEILTLDEERIRAVAAPAAERLARGLPG